jgi:hypothetical protein
MLDAKGGGLWLISCHLGNVMPGYFSKTGHLHLHRLIVQVHDRLCG